MLWYYSKYFIISQIFILRCTSEIRYYEKIGKDETKDITDEVDFDLPENWELIRLSSICWLDDIKQSNGEKLPYLDAKTLRGKKEKTFITNGKIVDIGTKVILVDGENSGEVFDIPYRGYMGSTFKVLRSCDSFDLQYLNVVLNFYQDMFRGNKIGAAIPHLNKKSFRDLLIGFPPLNEQERIVAEIEKYEPLIAEYGKLEQQKSKLDGEIYDKLKKSILQYAIQGKLVPQDENDEPASELLKRIRAEKKAQLGKKYVDSYIYKGDDNCYYEHINGKAKDEVIEVPFDLPINWMWCRLDTLALYKKGPFGSSLTKDMFVPKSNTSVKVYEQKNAIYKDCTLGEYYISEQKYSTMKSFEVFANDIIVSCAGTIGETYILPYNCPRGIINQALMKITLFKQEIVEFYLLYFDYMLKIQAQQSSKGSAIKNIPPFEILKNMLMPIPPLAEQRRILDIINEIFAKL